MWDCCFLPTSLTIHSCIWFISPDRLCFVFSNTVGGAGHRLSPPGGDVKKQRWALTVRGSTLDLSHSLSHSNPYPLPNHYHHYHQTCHGPVILEQHSRHLPDDHSHLGIHIKNTHPQASSWKLWGGAQEHLFLLSIPRPFHNPANLRTALEQFQNFIYFSSE